MVGQADTMWIFDSAECEAHMVIARGLDGFGHDAYRFRFVTGVIHAAIKYSNWRRSCLGFTGINTVQLTLLKNATGEYVFCFYRHQIMLGKFLVAIGK